MSTPAPAPATPATPAPASLADPRSVQFRQEREKQWRELELLVDRALRRGPRSLSEDELYRLPLLYRSAMASLSVARRTAMDRRLVAYLEALAARAYLVVYGSRRSTVGAVRRFLGETFPRDVRRLWPELALATLIFALAMVVAASLTSADPAWYYAFVPEQLAGERTPESTRDELREPLYARGDGLITFASFLFTHNARIGMLSFALGIAAGLPTALLVFLNGLILGAFFALHAEQGLLFAMLGWLLPHGIPEIAALLLCAAAGLHIGRALVWPGRLPVRAALAQAGRRGAGIVLGCILLFAVAGLVEGLFRQTIQDDWTRYGFAAFNLGWLGLWILYAGRQRPALELEGGHE
ncbi:MAG: stage II sporulation protein M [Phycisphaeraceae bacterium]